jgi:hypothetical protein
MYILVNIKWHVSAQSRPSSGLTISLKDLLCMWAMMWRSLHQSLFMQCLLAMGDKERIKTIYIALVTLESPSGGVTYRHGVAVVSLFSRDMLVPLWVTGVGSVLQVWSMQDWSYPSHPQRDPHITGEERHHSYPMTICYTPGRRLRRHQSDIPYLLT